MPNNTYKINESTKSKNILKQKIYGTKAYDADNLWNRKYVKQKFYETEILSNRNSIK